MKLLHLLEFIPRYIWEVIRSTAQLALLVLKPRIELNPTFVEVPLSLEGDVPRLFLACLITMTPGTLSVALDKERNILLVHLLDSRDKAASIAELKDRIEAPLCRIFNP